MRNSIVIGNWKMNGNGASITALLEQLLPQLSGLQCEVALCAPFPYLLHVGTTLHGSAVSLGAQNLSHLHKGALTGEVSGPMLSDVGCRYVLVGHSERRTLFGEYDELVALKFDAALAAGLTPVLCVGETLDERCQGITQTVIERQLHAVIEKVGIERMALAVIAYEPVWAIGTGETATPQQAQEVHLQIRQLLARQNPQVARDMSIVYGGSVRAENASELFEQPDIDGGLIGGASLEATSFAAICKAA